ncbi:MAG: hypothetical protein ACREN4_03100 [Candidatus Dormibacteria bacterium]
MAEVQIDGDQLVVKMTGMEKLESMHGDLRVPLSSVRSVQVSDNPSAAISGMKLVGTGLPGGTAVGTWTGSEGETFAVEHHGSRGIVVTLEGARYQQLVIGCEQPEEVAARIQAAAPSLGG